MQFKSFHWLRQIMVYHALQLIMVSLHIFFAVSNFFLFYFYKFLPFRGIFNKAITPLVLVGYEIIIAKYTSHASLAIYHLVSASP